MVHVSRGKKRMIIKEVLLLFFADWRWILNGSSWQCRHIDGVVKLKTMDGKSEREWKD